MGGVEVAQAAAKALRARWAKRDPGRGNDAVVQSSSDHWGANEVVARPSSDPSVGNGTVPRSSSDPYPWQRIHCPTQARTLRGTTDPLPERTYSPYPVVAG
jgi:hypothetical protein